ncbi:intracellular protein transport protein USO1-like [Rhododendron vialii]|uniref:intracellular protein transport protein USO1-like n=1 Tax=Rhododendron vialii TaxID=182163 RepID=UPI00265E2049|nr:intracellular protein transport protein USO1-like [Rhododendron vialii]
MMSQCKNSISILFIYLTGHEKTYTQDLKTSYEIRPRTLTMEEAGVITRSKTQPDRPATSLVSQSSQNPSQTQGKKRQRPKQEKVAKKRQRLTQQSESEPDSPIQTQKQTQQKKHQSPKQKKKAMKQESESESESQPDSPTQTQKQCTFRSNVIGTMGLLSKLNLNNAHLELLKQTPFWMLIDAIRKGKLAEKACMKHDKTILSIIQNYDTNDSKFLIGGKKVAITRNDIKLIFGIACGNKQIGDLNKKKSDVAFAKRRGIQEARIGSKKMKDMINEILSKKEESITEEDIQDVVRLVCMFICLTLFFSTSGVTIAWTYVHCMEKIEEIKDYDWAQSIAETLNTSMHKFHDKPRDATGCVVALMYWICEHTDLIARPKNEAIPRLLNWNTSDLKKRIDDFKDLSNLNITVYEEELQETCQEAQVYSMPHPEVVDDNDRGTISQMMQHTQSPQSPALRLDEIHLTEKQQPSPLVSTSSTEKQQAMFSQSQSGETMVPSTYQPLDSINFSQGLIKEHNQMGKFCDSLLENNDQVIIKDLQQQVQYIQNQKQILEQQNHGLQNDKDAMKNELEEMQKERDAMKEKLQKIVTMSNTMLQAQEQHKFLIEKTAVLEKDSDTMKNQLLEMEKERDSLEQKLQKMDTISNVLKKDRDEMEKQLLEMGKERDEFEKQKHMMLEQFEIEKNKIKKALTMQVESLMTEKGQLQKYLSTTEQRQKAIIVQKDAEIRNLTNKLSLTSKLSIQPQHTKEPQKHLPVLETDSSLLTQRSEEAIHNITQTERF